MLPQENPLLDFSGLPQFERIKPEHVAPTIASLLRNTVRAASYQAGALAFPGA